MKSINSIDAQSKSESNQDSKAELIGKYIIHGMVFGFGLAFLNLIAPFWFYLPDLLGIAGGILVLLIMSVPLGWGNAETCSWLWNVEVIRYWRSLYPHGMLLAGFLYVQSLTLNWITNQILAQGQLDVLNVVVVCILSIGSLIAEGYILKFIGMLFAEKSEE